MDSWNWKSNPPGLVHFREKETGPWQPKLCMMHPPVPVPDTQPEPEPSTGAGVGGAVGGAGVGGDGVGGVGVGAGPLAVHWRHETGHFRLSFALNG
mmetsp:Transcript_14050/g.29424  ORF Transcript_14050/g.29424 Transcript_14050/m.29424 type:complete len:96 (-) Transcript_14050:889-1176(-)